MDTPIKILGGIVGLAIAIFLCSLPVHLSVKLVKVRDAKFVMAVKIVIASIILHLIFIDAPSLIIEINNYVNWSVTIVITLALIKYLYKIQWPKAILILTIQLLLGGAIGVMIVVISTSFA